MRQENVIGVLTYNQIEFLFTFLFSIQGNTQIPHKLVIADNSTDPAYISKVEALGQQFGATTLHFRENRGTSAAWNAIAQLYQTENVMIFNDDCRVKPGWDEAIIRGLTQPHIG